MYSVKNTTFLHFIARQFVFLWHYNQWRNKVAVGPRASIPKGPPLPPKKTLKKTASGKFWAPHSAGPACTARLARPIVTPLITTMLFALVFVSCVN